MNIPTIEALYKSKSRAELEEMYLELTGSRCACCKSKVDVAKQIVRFMQEQRLNGAYAGIVV